MNPFDPFGFDELGDGPLRPVPRRWPQYSVDRRLDGTVIVTTSEPGGPQRALWVDRLDAWTPGKDGPEPPRTVYDVGVRREPTEEFKALVADLWARNDTRPDLMRGEVRRT